MEEHDRIADEGLQEADDIGRASEDLKGEIDDTRSDWDSKKKQEAVPGAIKTEAEAEAEKYVEPNEFEFEERKPETAEAQGPGALDESSDDEDDDS
jgi:hypothetical protein